MPEDKANSVAAKGAWVTDLPIVIVDHLVAGVIRPDVGNYRPQAFKERGLAGS